MGVMRSGWKAGRVDRALAALVLLLAGCLGVRNAARADEKSALPAPVPVIDVFDADPDVPTPASVIGHELGDGAVRYEPMLRYARALVERSPFVRLTEYGATYEGRTLFYLTISSEANLNRLDAIRADAGKLANPRSLRDDAEAQRILDALPGIAWLAYSIHGDELSSTDAALAVAYRLAAGRDEVTRKWRDELVIHIDPLMNPDGRERSLSHLQQLSGHVPNHDYASSPHTGIWGGGRGNHYFFDMNRDWVMQVHPETRGRTTAILSWSPHLLVDSHEMGPLDTYLFDPPREPRNVNLSEKNLAWRRVFSKDQAAALDRIGSSYYTQEWYEEWYTGYTNGWFNLLGGIGLLYEQAGVDGSGIRQASGKLLTYREAVRNHVTSSFANLETLRANRKAIQADFLSDRRWAVDASRSGGEAFLFPPMADTRRAARFLDVLAMHRIEFAFAESTFAATTVQDLWGKLYESREFPKDTIVVPAAQPHRRLLRAILEFDPHMSEAFLNEERRELEQGRSTRLYDVTAWNLPMAYGLESYVAASLNGAKTTRTSPVRAKAEIRKGRFGFLIDGRSGDVHRAIVRLLDAGGRVRVAEKPFTIMGRSFEPGAVLVANSENEKLLDGRGGPSLGGLDLDIIPVDTSLSEAGPDLGGSHFHLLERPRVALLTRWPASATSFGAIWHLLDYRTEIGVSTLQADMLRRYDLRRYNVIVIPDLWSPEVFGAMLDEGMRRKLRSWVEAGGTLVAMGGSAAALAGKDVGMTSVRLRPDVLEQLPEYEEYLRREQAARRVKVDPASVWKRVVLETPDDSTPTPGIDKDAADPAKEGGSSGGEKPAAGKAESQPGAKKAPEELKREHAWQSRFAPSGAIAAAVVAADHWLCFGAWAGNGPEARLPVLVSGSHAFMTKGGIQTAVRLGPPESLRLSGLLWPEARELLGNSAYVMAEKVGDGQVILFASDPVFRGYWEATARMLLNAVILGPGMGASHPIEW